MLDIQDLHVRFRSAPAGKEAVKGISLHMNAGEILGLVGESGSGKTVTAMALAGLLSNAKVELSGHIFFEGLDLLRASRETVRSMRGKDIAVVFQEPMTSMDPVMRIGPQVEEALLVHTDLGPEERRARALQAMADAELPDPDLLTVEEVLGLDALEPYGAGNPKPVFCLSGCTVSACADVGGGRHLKLKLSRGGRTLDAIFFSSTAAAAGVAAGDRVDVAFTPQINEFRGARTVQLLVCDLRPAPTRMEAEQALYERLRRGESLTAQEAAALIPSRTEFVAVWRYLSGHARLGRVEDTARRLARSVARTYGIKETVMRTMVCLEVLDEHGLIQVEQSTDHLRISVQEVSGKVDLEASKLLRHLRRLAEEA